MSKIVFINEPSKVYDGTFSQIGSNQVRLVFSDAVQSTETLTSGFNLVNEHNGRVQTKRTEYIYIYRTYANNPSMIELCNNNSPYVEPEITVTFNTGFGGTLEGTTSQIAKNYEELVIPTPVADENYKFVEWNPEIPTSGKIENNITFTAQFEYVPTEEELAIDFENAKQSKILESKVLLEKYLEENPLLSDCHGGVVAKYTVTQEKQSLMASNYLTYTIAKESGVENPVLTWNAAGCECEEWTEEEYVTLVLQISAYVKPLVSLQQSYEVQITNCKTEEELNNIVIDYSVLSE